MAMILDRPCHPRIPVSGMEIRGGTFPAEASPSEAKPGLHSPASLAGMPPTMRGSVLLRDVTVGRSAPLQGRVIAGVPGRSEPDHRLEDEVLPSWLDHDLVSGPCEKHVHAQIRDADGVGPTHRDIEECDLAVTVIVAGHGRDAVDPRTPAVHDYVVSGVERHDDDIANGAVQETRDVRATASMPVDPHVLEARAHVVWAGLVGRGIEDNGILDRGVAGGYGIGILPDERDAIARHVHPASPPVGLREHAFTVVPSACCRHHETNARDIAAGGGAIQPRQDAHAPGAAVGLLLGGGCG